MRKSDLLHLNILTNKIYLLGILAYLHKIKIYKYEINQIGVQQCNNMSLVKVYK